MLQALSPGDIEADDGDIQASKMWHTTIGPNQCIVVPPGMFTIEQTIPVASGSLTNEQKSESMPIGFRVHFLESSESDATKAMKNLKLNHSKRLTVADDCIVFWNVILDALTKSDTKAAPKKEA